MRRVLENEYSMIKVYQSGMSSKNSSQTRQTVEIELDENEQDKPDFSKLFNSALANITIA